jgi:ElaB/YqjD/DUF883 family membrane-anchored ribosome-binding protein
MAAKDAEMPNHTALKEEIEKITKHLHTLRADIQGLSGAVTDAGEHQAARAKDAANEALAALEDAVKQNPTKTLGIALGVGFLLGIILRR